MLSSPDSRTIWITVANRYPASDEIAPHRYDTVHNGRTAAQLNNRRKSDRAGCDSSSTGFLLYRRFPTLAGKRQARAILNDEIRKTVDPEGK